jgi:tetratricopeptide (TPR) repeat protein
MVIESDINKFYQNINRSIFFNSSTITILMIQTTSWNFLGSTLAVTIAFFGSLTTISPVVQAKTTFPGFGTPEAIPEQETLPHLKQQRQKQKQEAPPLDLQQLNDLIGELGVIVAQPFYEQGNALLEQKDFQGAIAQYNQAIDTYSEYAEAYVNRAVAKAELGDRSGAINDLQEAARLFEKNDNTQGYQQVQELLSQLQ